MVNFTAETLRKNFTIADKAFTCPQPFAAGHVLTDNEAAVMNQVLSENVRNNIAPKIKKGEEVNQEIIDKYVAGYEFGIRSISTSDPVQKEIRRIAEDALGKKLASKGMSKAKLTKEQYGEMVDSIIQNNYDALYNRAIQVIEIRAASLDLEA